MTSTEPDTTGTPSETTVDRPWHAFSVTMLVGFMALLDVTIVNVAVPSIQHGLDASPQAVQWVVSGYALAFGLTLVAGGRLGDVVGRRRMFLVGLVAFTATSAFAGAAWNSTVIVVARLLQGASAGLLTPQNTGLIQQLFQGEQRGRAFGVFGTTVGVSAASGPLIGGLLITGFGAEEGWRWVFYVNVPIGILGIVLALRLLPKARTGQRSVARQVDPLGAVLLGAAVIAVLLPVVEAQTSLGTPWWWLLLAAPVAGAAFVRHERAVIDRGGAPLLDIRLFGESEGFGRGIAIGTVYFCAFSGIWLVLALFLQDQLGYTALRSGLTVMPFAVGSAVSSVVAGRLVGRHGRRVTVTGLWLVVAGFAALAVVTPFAPDGSVELWVLGPLMVAGIGSGATISPNITLALQDVPPAMGGAAGGALQTGQRIGSAVGAAILATTYRLTLGGHGAATATAATFAVSVLLAGAALALALHDLRSRRTAETSGPRT